MNVLSGHQVKLNRYDNLLSVSSCKPKELMTSQRNQYIKFPTDKITNQIIGFTEKWKSKKENYEQIRTNTLRVILLYELIQRSFSENWILIKKISPSQLYSLLLLSLRREGGMLCILIWWNYCRFGSKPNCIQIYLWASRWDTYS